MANAITLESGRTVELSVKEANGCVTVSQRFCDSSGKFLSKTCTVTCSTGKSYSWTCSDSQDCFGDCSDPNNPRGSCV